MPPPGAFIAPLAVPGAPRVGLKLYGRGGNFRYVCNGATAIWAGPLVTDLFDSNGHKVGATRADFVLELVDGSTYSATSLGVVGGGPTALTGSSVSFSLTRTAGNTHLFRNIKFAQRLNVAGGANPAPATACAPANNGAIQSVPAEADYFFYE